MECDYCSVCLITGVKMSTTSVGYEVLQFLRLQSIIYSEARRASFCYECGALLQKFEKFRQKCNRAQEVLSKMSQNYEKTSISIQNIDRKQHKLVSTMTLNTIHCMTIDSIQINNSDIEDNFFNVCEFKPNFENLTGEVDIQGIKNEIKDDEQETSLHDDEMSEDKYPKNSTIYNTLDHIQKKQKTISIKEHRVKKRKTSTNDLLESISDEEPLANKVSKMNKKSAENGVKKKYHKNCSSKLYEEYATVVFLSPEDAKTELLLRKESSNYRDSPFKCKFCYRGFETDATFENHMKKHSNENGAYECEICHLRFPEPRSLYKHRLAMHKRKFSCKLCSYVCFCPSQAKTHISLHKGKKYPCNKCGEIFSMPNSLLMHKRMKHVTECVCYLCGNTFATPRGLYSHQMLIHRQDNNEKRGPICEECGIHFANEDAWKLHLVFSSKHNVSNGCKTCGESFPNSAELKTHMKSHTKKRRSRLNKIELPTTCTICSKYITDFPEYKSHMSLVHPHSAITKKLEADQLSPFICETCGLAFKRQCLLNYHQRTHTGERPYKCPQCDKSFRQTGALTVHKAVHSQQTHTCRLCNRVFTFKSGLEKHMKIHLNIRPHRCDICDKSFIHPCDVRTHIKYVHNKVPWPKRDRAKKTQDT